MNNSFRGFGAVFYKEALHVRRDLATLAQTIDDRQ